MAEIENQERIKDIEDIEDIEDIQDIQSIKNYERIKKSGKMITYSHEEVGKILGIKE